MSQTAMTVTNTTEVKKERKPTLSEKYMKFLVSNFNLIRVLESKGLLNAEGVESAYSEIKLLAPIEEQGAYYESLLNDMKGSKGNPGIKSQMKKFITQRNKPPKAPRVKKERKTKDAAPVEGEAKPKKERKPRAKKETKVSDDTKNDVVAELVEAANSSLESPPPSVNEVVPDAPKKARKPRTKKTDVEAAPAVQEAPVETKTKKERKPRTKKTDVVEAAPVVEDEMDGEEIHTNEFMIDGKTYLIDSDNNLYDVDSHEEVGTYDANTSSIVPL